MEINLPTTRQQEIIAASPAMRRVLAEAERFALSELPILLVGATGTGKEVLAQFIHGRSGRRGDLVDVDCGALPREMIEGLLFGHRRGAFTGAIGDTTGLISCAAGGTLFLDEFTSLSLEAQAKLLRVLDTREVRSLGALAKRAVDFRLITAVQQDVAQRLADGSLRSDLFHRVAGGIIEIPPLCRRAEDILPLATYFAHERGCALSADAEAVLVAHDWPGNVRELRTLIARASVLSDGAVDGFLLAELLRRTAEIGATHEPKDSVTGKSMAETLRDLGRDCEWDIDRIARRLGIHRSTVYRRLRALGILAHHLPALRSSRAARVTH